MDRKYIYLVKAGNTSFYKIGISDNPQKRLAEIQTGCPHKLKLLSYGLSDDPHTLEKDFHKRYERYRAAGEWFNLPFWKVREAKTLISLPHVDEWETRMQAVKDLDLCFEESMDFSSEKIIEVQTKDQMIADKLNIPEDLLVETIHRAKALGITSTTAFVEWNWGVQRGGTKAFVFARDRVNSTMKANGVRW